MITRGMARRGSCVSSPSVAAASKPANERKPNTAPVNTPDSPTSEVNVKTSRVNRAPPGAEPLISRTAMMALTSRISAIVAPSTRSSRLVPRRAGATASSHAPTSATPVSTHGPQAGAFGQIPTWPRNAVPSTPAAEAVVTA